MVDEGEGLVAVVEAVVEGAEERAGCAGVAVGEEGDVGASVWGGRGWVVSGLGSCGGLGVREGRTRGGWV